MDQFKADQVQEKKKPRLSDNNVIKNGIHIMVPDLVLNLPPGYIDI
jgi:hypothetical protein